MCSKLGIDINKKVAKTEHLYAIGSILMGYQDMIVWSSGFGYDKTVSSTFKLYKLLRKIRNQKNDVRAMRGPETRRILISMVYSCPEVYGDLAVLLPIFYPKDIKKKYEYTVVPHYSKNQKYNKDSNFLDPFNKNQNGFVEKIVASKLVISSSFYGIIIAESYGVPAVMLKDTPCDDITKYKDWYYSTGRKSFSVAKDIDEALVLRPSILQRKNFNQNAE